MKRSTTLALMGGVLICFWTVRKPPSAAPGASPGGAAEPVIVRLAGRGQTITITAGPGTPRYSATDASGRSIVSQATLEQLRVNHPDLYQQLKPAVVMDASVGSLEP